MFWRLLGSEPHSRLSHGPKSGQARGRSHASGQPDHPSPKSDWQSCAAPFPSAHQAHNDRPLANHSADPPKPPSFAQHHLAMMRPAMTHGRVHQQQSRPVEAQKAPPPYARVPQSTRSNGLHAGGREKRNALAFAPNHQPKSGSASHGLCQSLKRHQRERLLCAKPQPQRLNPARAGFSS